jgi:SAM-dependent methyltransferase
MHASALDYGKRFFDMHAEERFQRVLDVGSLDINGSLRSVCPRHLAYTGIDLSPGNGVDVVLSDPYVYPFPDGHFDVIVATSCFEHDPLFWITFLECLRVLAPGGVFYINAPSNGFYHGHPFDHWRFFPDAGLALQTWAKRSGIQIDLLESFTAERRPGEFWNDFVMVFRKPDGSPAKPGLISADTAACTNIRRIGQTGFIRPMQLTEDMRLIDALRAEVAGLRKALATPDPVAADPVSLAPPIEDQDGICASEALADGSPWCFVYRNNTALASRMPLTIYVVAYRRYAQIACLVHSLQAQTMPAFHLVILHDGPDFAMLALLSKLSRETTLSFEFRFSRTRHNDYGHSLREQAILDCDTDYILLTNDDNYYVPTFVELMVTAAQRHDLDLVLCDMVHSHDRPGGRPVGSYAAFPTHPSAGNADIGCFITRTDRARRVGFRDKASEGDGTFIADLIALGPALMRWGKVDKILFVHN